MSNNDNASVTLTLTKAEFVQSLNEATGAVNTSFEKMVAYSQQLKSGTRSALRDVQVELNTTAATAASAGSRIGAAYLEEARAARTTSAATKILKDETIDATLRTEIYIAAKKREAEVLREVTAAEEAAGLAAKENIVGGAIAAGAEIRILDGNFNALTRATENFLSKTLGLGTLLQTLFPVAGALAFIHMLGQMGEAIIDETEKLQGMTDAKKALYKNLVDDNNKKLIDFDTLPQGNFLLQQTNKELADLQAKKAKLEADPFRDSPLGAVLGAIDINKVSDEIDRIEQRQAAQIARIAQLKKAADKDEEARKKQEKQDADAAAKQAKTDFEQKQRDLDKYNTDALKYLQAQEREQDIATRHSLQVLQQETAEFIKAEEKRAAHNKEMAARELEAGQVAADGKMRLEQMQLQESTRNAEFLYQTHQITYQRRTEIIRAAMERERQLEMQQLAFKLQLALQDPDHPERRQRILNEIAQLEEQYRQKELQLDQQAALHRQQVMESSVQKVSQAFTSGINGYLRGQQSLASGLKQSFADMAMSGIEQVERLGAKWITQHLLMKAASFLFHTEDTAAQTAANAAKLTDTITTNVAASASDAALAAAGAFAWWSGVNPIIAPGMAAAAYSEGMGFTALASARNGMVSAEEQMAFIHKNEMVLPASLSMGFQSIIGRMNSATGSGDSGGGDFHMHGDVNYNAAKGDDGLGSRFWTEFRRGIRHGKHLG